MAQYYGVMDYRILTPPTAAVLAIGLPWESRIMRRFSKAKLTLDEMLMAVMVDSLQILIWQQTKNGRKGLKKPKSLYTALTEDGEKQELEVFEDPDDYLKWRESKGM